MAECADVEESSGGGGGRRRWRGSCAACTAKHPVAAAPLVNVGEVNPSPYITLTNLLHQVMIENVHDS